MFLKKQSGAVSKTVMFNLIALLLGVLDLVQASPVIPPEYLPYFALAIGIVNLVLRIFFTSEPVRK